RRCGGDAPPAGGTPPPPPPATKPPPPTATPAPYEHQRRLIPFRHRARDAAPQAAAPCRRRSGGVGSHEPDEGDRRHIEQRFCLDHCCGLTGCFGPKILRARGSSGPAIAVSDRRPAPFPIEAQRLDPIQFSERAVLRPLI